MKSVLNEIEMELTPCPSWLYGGCFCRRDCSDDLEYEKFEREENEFEKKYENG